MLKFRKLFRILLCAALTAFVVLNAASCSRTVPAADAAEGAVSFAPTVYYARDGHVRFLYDAERDMLASIENYDMISLYDAGTYSLVISYREGQTDRKTADAAVKDEFSAEGFMEVSNRTKGVKVSGCSFRRAEITCADGSTGAVLYGNTATGFAEVYYLLSPDAEEGTLSHVEEILSTVRFAEFDGADEDEDNFSQVFAQ